MFNFFSFVDMKLLQKQMKEKRLPFLILRKHGKQLNCYWLLSQAPSFGLWICAFSFYRLTQKKAVSLLIKLSVCLSACLFDLCKLGILKGPRQWTLVCLAGKLVSLEATFLHLIHGNLHENVKIAKEVGL